MGENNYGHPFREVLEKPAVIKGEVRRTDVEGIIRWVPNKNNEHTGSGYIKETFPQM